METRKQIIELISDYMDKTLSEGCLFYDYLDRMCRIISLKEILSSPWNVTRCYHKQKVVEYRFTEYLERKDCEPWYNEQSIWWEFPVWWYNAIWECIIAEEIYRGKTIGHYDITAVLKYIDNSYRDKRWMPHWDILVELTPWDIHINIWEELYMLPNKPLSLYSEQEEKDLLELLTKIWLTNK